MLKSAVNWAVLFVSCQEVTFEMDVKHEYCFMFVCFVIKNI